MALKLSIEPGFFLEPQVATWQVSPGTRYVIFNEGGVPPAISEYIAYDTLVPPNPFIAVTQDGTGNVVYDGGFPKMYNRAAPAAGSTFNDLTTTFKFLHNVLKWIANPTKVANGNNKILVLGDSIGTYNVKDTSETGFKISIDRLMAAANFVPTYKNPSDYDGFNLLVTLEELEDYCAVFLMSSVSTTASRIHVQAVTDIASFRSQGNGVFIMTDHGQVVNSIGQATNLTSSSLFATANTLAVQFGAYFSGDYNRTPVNVGFLRETYGDHPLYNGLSNSDSIYAGGSESRVVVADFERFTPAQLPPITIDQTGQNVVQAVALLEDGTIETYRGVFVVAEGDVLQLTKPDGTVINSIDVGKGSYLPALRVVLDLEGAGTVRGNIRLNNTVLANFVHTDAGGTTTTWVVGPNNIKVNDGDVLTAAITLPFTYSTSIEIGRFQPDIGGRTSLAEINARLTYQGAMPFEAPLLAAVAGTGVTPSTSAAETVKKLNAYYERT